MTRKKGIGILILSVIVIAAIFLINEKSASISLFKKNKVVLNEEINEELKAEDFQDIVTESDFLIQPPTNWAAYKEPLDVKAIYMTGNTVGWKARFEELIEFIDNTEINAVVIDVKDDYGEFTYKSNVPMVNDVGADEKVKVKDFTEVINILSEKNIYPIARIVSFKDRTAAGKRQDLAVKSIDGTVWRDNKGDAWLNPYNRESWEYLIQIAEEAALMGFKEIQFDYVRFPTDGKRSLIDYGQAGKDELMQDAIAGFLSYARERLAPYGVFVSADIFGLVTTVTDDMKLGQHLETLATAVDILCPMVYPSHYALGSYGIQYPDADPYSIVLTSMKRAKERIDNLETTEKKAILRPWLQDFSATWLKKDYGPHYTPYGPKQIRDQIKATYDADLTQWIFWNASNKYTENAFEKID